MLDFDKVNFVTTFGKERYLSVSKDVLKEGNSFWGESDVEKMNEFIKRLFIRDFGTDNLSKVSYDIETDSYVINQ
jgi:hypothetical protein